MANKRIEALEKLLVLKEETIKELERQVQLLRNQPPVVITQPYQPLQPIGVPYQPLNPWPFTQPVNPLYPPYVITYTNGISCSITNDPNATYTFTNSYDGSTNVINITDVPHIFKQA